MWDISYRERIEELTNWRIDEHRNNNRFALLEKITDENHAVAS